MANVALKRRNTYGRLNRRPNPHACRDDWGAMRFYSFLEPIQGLTMKYILLCALLISGAFFSMSGHTQEQQPPGYTCPDGGTLTEYGGQQICSVPAPIGEQYAACHNGYCVNTTNIAEGAAAVAEYRTSQHVSHCGSVGVYSYVSHTPDKKIQFSVYRTAYDQLADGSCRMKTGYPTTSTAAGNWALLGSSAYCPPDNSPALINLGGDAPDYFCWVLATPEEKEPCDCSDLAGEGTLPYTSFIAQKGVYSTANPPQCNTVNDPDTGQQCHCQLVAQKWLQTTHTNNGVEYDRWSPLPYDKDKPSGTYTGVACGDEDADTAPPEKEECFTLKSGVKWCFANPDEKCTVVNGQEQCSTGCGYVNGDFVCYEDKDPIIPDRPNEDMEEIDDTITDPDKTMPDINKGDLKQIQRGTEQRLDNVIIGVNNNNNQLQNIGDKIGQTNSKLDGIGEQLDGQGKSLKGIADGIEDAFGDEGSPDGKCEGECTGSWYESAYPDGIVGIWEEHKQAFDQTPAFQFLNQFKVTPSGSQPDWSLCFNLGPMGDFGCDSIAVPDFVWNFIKICILITAAFLCRALIFGG